MIRSASQEDERALRNLCQSVYEDDYVLDHLSTWLKQRNIYVYEKDTIVGMVRLTSSRDGKANLGSIRVHPDHRRQGIATALTKYCISICRTDTIRLAIMDNEVSEAVARKIGFSPVATFTFLLKNVESFPAVRVKSGTPAEALSRLRSSPLFVHNHSLISSSFSFYTPSLENLEDLIILVNQNSVALLDWRIDEALRNTLQIAYCDCDPELVKAVLYTASQKNAQEIWAVVPKDDEIINILMISGFRSIDWGETITVFELLV